ncbi:flagellar basal body-associated FliL family protein [Motiliproteus sediminis]|uniref:flagellar basal body-associated FliL family protein n=1 Tax=Motiliproteus sediminis TaxID=1468178 RepID=UPI001AEFA58A|nr:flagellar basal body-associated FliL family protein [Motiliproteus sediminis]
MNRALQHLFLTLALLTGAAQALAAESAPDRYVEYVELNPPFIANYGGPGPLKYVKAEVSIKVVSRDGEVNTKHHQAQIRNAIVMLLSSQTDDTVSTAAGRERIRIQALEAVRQIMVQEYGETGYDMIGDLLFTSFVIQN